MPLKIDLEAGLRPTSSPPQESGTPDNRFVFQRKIGQGAEGIVYVAVPSDQTRSSDGSSSGHTREYRKPVAVKVVTGRAFERCCATRHLWSSLVHPNVVYPRSTYFDNANGRCFLEMELLASDLLEDIQSKGTLEDSRASEVAGSLAAALDHLHRRGVAHRDVKLENVFLRDGTVKLGDLGGIAHIHHSSVTTVPTADQDFRDSPPAVAALPSVAEAEPSSAAAAAAAKAPEMLGSTLYAAPESVRGGRLGSGGGINRRDLLSGDMWSLGVTLYSAVAGCHPWEVASERSKQFRRFLKKGIASIMPKSFSPGLKSLLTRLLALDPTHRPTAAQVLADPWVTAPPASRESPTMGVAPAAVEPAPVTPPGSESPSACGDAERSIFPLKAAPVDASPIPATKPRGRRPIAAVNRTARVATAAEAESYADETHTGCRKRKEPESEGGRDPLFDDYAEACWLQMSVLEGFIDGGSGGGRTPPSKRARVVAPSPLTLPGSAPAPTEAHALLATTARSWKEAATRLQEQKRPAEDSLPPSSTLFSAPGKRGT